MKISTFSRLVACLSVLMTANTLFSQAAQAIQPEPPSPRIQSLFTLPLGSLGEQPPSTPSFVECTKSGVCELKGKVKVVKSGAKYKIKIVTSFPDIKVKKVTSSPRAAGEWQMVDSFPDFTVEIVDSFPDFTVKYVTSFPGC